MYYQACAPVQTCSTSTTNKSFTAIWQPIQLSIHLQPSMFAWCLAAWLSAACIRVSDCVLQHTVSCISLSCLALPCFLHQGVTKQSCFCSFICSLTHQNAFAVFGVVLFWLAGRDQSAAMFDRTDFFMLQGVHQQLHQGLGQGLTEMPSTSAITAMLCPSQVCA